MGDERVELGQEAARAASGPEDSAQDLAVANTRPVLRTAAGVLAAQRVIGNQALQRLLRPGASPSGTSRPRISPVVARDGDGAPAPLSDGGGQAIAGNPGDTADPLNGGPGKVSYTYSKSPSSGGNFVFTDPDYNTLMATLTARMGKEEIGRCFPNLTLVLNGTPIPQSGTVTVPDDNAPVKTGTFTVVDQITLPTWTNVGAPAVQDAQKAEWNRYAAAVAAHEDLHAADDKAVYDPVGASLGQKKMGEAIDAVSKATTDANAKAAPRDASNPPPTLNPAGTTKVP